MLVSIVCRLSQKHRVCPAPRVAPTKLIRHAPPRSAARKPCRAAAAAVNGTSAKP